MHESKRKVKLARLGAQIFFLGHTSGDRSHFGYSFAAYRTSSAMRGYKFYLVVHNLFFLLKAG